MSEGSSRNFPKLGRPKRDSKQTTLEHFRLRRPRLDLNEDVLDTDGNVVDASNIIQSNVSLNEVEKKKDNVRTFLAHWNGRHNWAYSKIGPDNRQRVKCLWCSEFGFKSPFAKEGATTIQLQALDKHAESEPHKVAAQRWELRAHKNVMPIQKHVELMVDAEKQRIISVMQTMYFIVVQDMPLNFFYAQCEFMRYMRTPNMPVNDEYSAYTNRTSGMEFIKAAKEHYWEEMRQSISKSPFFSVLVDDSTDLTLEKHMIVYITYLQEEGKGPCVCKFVALLPLVDGRAQTKFDQLMGLLQKMGLMLEKMIGFASDGASCMRGVNNGVLAKIQERVPHIVGVHCVAHREALVVSDACDSFAEFKCLDAFANKVHAWVGRSVQRHKILGELLKAFTLRPLEVLRIHSVRWLSRGKVMKRLVTMMPALLLDFKVNDATLYQLATTFQVQFMVHFMADLLYEMNVLSKKFQKDHVDVTDVADALDVIVELFKKRYLGETFGYGSKNYRDFIRKLNGNNELVYAKENACFEIHALHFSPLLPHLTSGNSLNECISLAQSFVREIINGIDARFNDLSLFNAAKVFSPRSFNKDVSIRGQTHKVYLERLCAKFGEGDKALIDALQCEYEVDRFCLQVHKVNQSYGFIDAWEHCRGHISWFESFSNLMKIWQALLVIPVSTAACERGFSKQNRIKDDERSSLTLTTLENLMFLSLSAPHDLHEVQWDAIYEIWASVKFRRIRNLVA